MTVELGLTASPESLFTHAMEGDRADPNRYNFQEALAILQFQVLQAQKRTAVAQQWAAGATVLLFLATIGLVLASL
jgi:hypothetical protein